MPSLRSNASLKSEKKSRSSRCAGSKVKGTQTNPTKTKTIESRGTGVCVVTCVSIRFSSEIPKSVKTTGKLMEIDVEMVI